MRTMTSARTSRRSVLSVAAAGIAAVGIAAGGVLASAVPVQAMGTGNPYEDQQAGVTYTVYEPSYSAGLKMPHTPTAGPQCPSGTEAVLIVSYGTKNGRQFTVTEGNPMCSDIGSGATVLTTTIMGAKATVQAYCDPVTTPRCNKSDVKKYGGHLEVVLPAAPGLRSTTVWIETYGKKNLTAAQLVRVARSLAAVD